MKIFPELVADNLQAVSYQVYQSTNNSFEGEFSASSKCFGIESVSCNEILIFENEGGLSENLFNGLHRLS